jgi:iron(III) transport system ATP-binding protein
MAHVRLCNITKRYGDVTAVNRLNIEIEQGECFSMLGPSGCGKTTTLRMVAGFEDIDEGEISVGDKVFSSSAKKYYVPPEKRDIGMVFQAFAVWPHMNVFNNVAFPLQIRKMSRTEVTERTRRAIKYTGLAGCENTFPNELSGGQKQRIALARAIAINPTVMLLDEPLSNLDPKLREEMRFEIKDLQRKFGFTIIYVTHDQTEAMALSHRILVMDRGIVQQIDTPINIYKNPANKFVFSFIGLSNFLPAEIHEGAIYLEGAAGAGPVSRQIPPEITEKKMTLAIRPAEIDFAGEGGLRGVIRKKTYLGDIIDYRITVGGLEVRVQKSRRKGVYQEGDACMLKFNRILWYDREAS